MSDPEGVCVLIIGPDGNVWASASDFGKSNGLVSDTEAQRWRARDNARAEFISSTCNREVALAIKSHVRDSIIDELKRKGWREHVVKIGEKRE